MDRSAGVPLVGVGKLFGWRGGLSPAERTVVVSLAEGHGGEVSQERQGESEGGRNQPGEGGGGGSSEVPGSPRGCSVARRGAACRTGPGQGVLLREGGAGLGAAVWTSFVCSCFSRSLAAGGSTGIIPGSWREPGPGRVAVGCGFGGAVLGAAVSDSAQGGRNGRWSPRGDMGLGTGAQVQTAAW